MNYQPQIDALCRHLAIAPFLEELEQAGGLVDQETWQQIVEEAGRVAEGVIEPADRAMDEIGASVVDGRVRTAPGHAEAWQAFSEGGWTGLSLPEDLGGMGLPLILHTACAELFSRGSPAFFMLPNSNIAAASMLVDAKAEAIAETWIPHLLSGEWGATICISEPDAGSDVGRIRTRATPDGDGWSVTGEKCWISYGDEDLTQRIGHFMLARTGEELGVRGLSLFLVPDSLDDGTHNGVFVRRIEEKLGLHGSPTCVMGFEDAQATLIGPEGRGLQTLFHMMLRMRLSIGPIGIGVAEGAYDTALRYAQDRKQGGRPDQPPVPISNHADVQRMLLSMAGRIEAARGLSLACSNILELAELVEDGAAKARYLSLAQFLLPIVKDGGARLSFDVSSEAVQVLGGAGYTREWPVEQRLRDARVFAVFEGTSGIQAIDMVHRRLWREEGEGLGIFLEEARNQLTDDAPSALLAEALDTLDECAKEMTALRDTPREGEAGALAFLDLCGLCASGWIALRIMHKAGDDPIAQRMKAGARFYLAELPAQAAMMARQALLGSERLEGFAALLDE